MTNEELICSLRYCFEKRKTVVGVPWYVWCDRAADALEAAEKRIADLENDLMCGTVKTMKQRLIDANAYAAEMKTRQNACEEIMDAAKQDENWEVYDRMNTAFGVFVEAKLTLDNAPTVDAVPVEWIENYVKWLRKREIQFAPVAIETMLSYYKDSQEYCDSDGERRTE